MAEVSRFRYAVPISLVAVVSVVSWGLFTPPSHASGLRRTAVVRVVQDAAPSVVNINGHKTVQDETSTASHESGRRVNGMGTGVLIDERGYIITNHHVVEGVRQIRVTMLNGEIATAKLIAHDPLTDLAVIKIPATKKLPMIRIGSSQDLMPGEPVVAVGNAFGYEHTVTRGIISALHRSVQVSDTHTYEDLIQTDASINPGNSGGPLLNIDGELIGINVAVRVGAQGIGFAIPVDKAMQVAAELISSERLTGTWHGIVGSTILEGERTHFVVDATAPNSPAHASGVRAGDRLVSVNEIPVVRALDLERALLNQQVGHQASMRIERDGSEKTLELVLQSAPKQRSPVAVSPTWKTLGLTLVPESPQNLSRMTSRYTRGLRVTEVRPNSVASRNGIQPGDVLVGMHVWETASLNDLEYVLKQPDLQQEKQVKFYVVRDGETLVGQLPLRR